MTQGLMNKFAALILSHGRAQNVRTYEKLRKHGYRGDIYIVIDDEDNQADQYRAKYPNKVIQFSKEKYEGSFDKGDNFKKRNSVIYARNAIWDIARELQLESFVMLDDDYTEFKYRFDEKARAAYLQVASLGGVFARAVRALVAAPNLSCIALAQGGDYIGGAAKLKTIGAKRKIMNVFVCLTDRPFAFVGRMNDDVNTYVAQQRSGSAVFYTTFQVSVDQVETQQADGGLTEMYKEHGTYVKSFYTVMYAPSCAKVRYYDGGGRSIRRIHHQIDWNACAPKIIRETLRKPREAA